MGRDLSGAEIRTTNIAGLEITMPAENGAALRARERARRLMQINIDRDFSGETTLTLDAKAGAYRDTVSRKLDIQPMGFPFENSKGGMLETNSTTSFELTIPAEMIRGSARTSVNVYPTPLASMTEALQALLRQPNGCFEQTSSTSYPMVMAQQYFLTHTGIEPEIIEKTKSLLEASYKKLTGFESRTKGYEWFGADPGHEALTAYGLMQFTDMAMVRDVDKEMIQRTRDWLLSRRDGDGGFSRNSKALDTFGRAPQETTNAYITWALVESGQKGLEKEIAGVKASAMSSGDSYLVALAAFDDAETFHDMQFRPVRRAEIVDEGKPVLADGVHDQHIALVMADRFSVPGGFRVGRMRHVHVDMADRMIGFRDHDDLV
jgi:hypothetical protein